MLDFIKSRRSTRRYKKDKVPAELIEQVVEAGRYAPCGGNNQSTHFFVVTNETVLDEIAKIAEGEFAKMEAGPDTYPSLATSINASKKGGYRFHFNAPVLIITANREAYDNNMADCACALENMMLMANALDLGSCYVNQLKWLRNAEPMLEYMYKLGMKEEERVYGAMVIGYADTPDGLPNRMSIPRKGNIVTIID